MDSIYTLQNNEIPTLLREINDAPKKLYIKGKLPNINSKILCIVGARKHTSYGEEACKKIIRGLKGKNITIVSGLAIGIDSIAHRTAIECELQTIAFPGSGLDQSVLYPKSNRRLAEEIIYAGGGLISEFEMMQMATNWTFPKRNRLMAGISHATLVIEAELQSGTLITSKLATDYNRDVGAIPGNIFSSLSDGPNMLIGLGAKIVKDSNDVLDILGMRRDEKESMIQNSLFQSITENERKIIDNLNTESMTNEKLLYKTMLSPRELSEAISMLEINNLISESNGIFTVKR